MTSTACVRLQGVCKRFAATPVLDVPELAFPVGAVSAVVGASGSGKSTLLQLINAVYRPDSGTVYVFDQPVPESGLPAFRRRIGYSVQGAGLFPHLGVRDNVTLMARLASWDPQRIEQRYRELCAFMAVDASLDARYPHQLSGGQQQRVGLCRALMLSPQLLLLDEPFSALDPITRRDIQGHFRALQERDALSTLLVTHDMAEAVELASYLVILRGGRVLQAGATDEVVAAPADDYVGRLLSEHLS